MSNVSYNKFGRGNLYYDVSGKVKLLDRNIKEVKLKLTTKTGQSKFLRGKSNFSKQTFIGSKTEIKELREANNSLNESVEASSKLFDRLLKSLELETTKF